MTAEARGSGIVGRAVRGASAGAVGTAAMDLLLYIRYRRGGGKDPLLRWESAGGDLSAQLVFGVTTSATYAALTRLGA